MIKYFLVLFFGFVSLFGLSLDEATISDFREVKGIGKKTAERIIQYRDEHQVTDIDDLIHVKGVGKRKLERIKALFNSNEQADESKDTEENED
jgi:competence ComEA-like helix-hairpin-helix protein